jgi:hypothetical protein
MTSKLREKLNNKGKPKLKHKNIPRTAKRNVYGRMFSLGNFRKECQIVTVGAVDSIRCFLLC